MNTKTEHEGEPKDCKACKTSKAPPCTKCGHKLTGKYDDKGRTVCPVCGEPEWLGVGEYND